MPDTIPTTLCPGEGIKKHFINSPRFADCRNRTLNPRATARSALPTRQSGSKRQGHRIWSLFFFSKIDEYQSGMTIFNNLRSIDHFTCRIITSISKFLPKVHEIQICFDRQRMASSNVVLWNEEKIDLGFKFVEEISKSSIDWYLLTRGLIGWPFVTVVKKPYHCGHLTFDYVQ